MNYEALIRRAWNNVKSRRWLWWLGLLAGFTEGSMRWGGNIGRLAGGPASVQVSPSPAVSPLAGSPVAATASPNSYAELTSLFEPVFNWAGSHLLWMLGFGVLALLLLVVIYYWSYTARAGLILAADSIEEHKKELGFKKAMEEGRSAIGQLFVYDLLNALLVIVPVLVVGTVAFALAFLAVLTNPLLILAVVLIAIAAFICFIIYGVTLSSMRFLASRMIVLRQLSASSALSEAYQLFRRQWQKVVGSLFTIAIVQGAIGLVLVIVLAAIFIPIFLGLGLSTVGGAAAIHVTSTGALVFVLTLIVLFVQAIISAFASTYWTLAYRALVYIDQHKKE